MVDFPSWVQDNWFDVVGALGIMGSLWMGIAAANREAKARETQNLLTLAEHHRELWNSLCQRPELDRILREDTDVQAKPATVIEEVSVNAVMIQYLTAWRISNAGGIITLKELAADVKGFFCLPLPHSVWEKTKQFRNPKFVRFVDRAIERIGRGNYQ